MSTISISYDGLNDASGEAKAVARKLDAYADSLFYNVYRKFDNCEGARVKIDAKISELRDESERYEAYASELTELRKECQEVDRAVKTKVSSLTETFKADHGIRNSKVENAISYFCAGVGNNTAFGRWLGSKSDEFDAKTDHLWSEIKEWYNYDGGKDIIKGCLTVGLEVAIAVTGVVVAVATFLAGALTIGAVVVLAAALVGAAIAIFDAAANLENEVAAYEAHQNGDPATAKRRSAINSYADYLRSSYMFGEDGEMYRYDESYNGLAKGLEITSVVCSVVTIINSCGKLLKNGFKWATGSTKVSFEEIFSKKGLTTMLDGMKSKFKSGITSLGESLKRKDWQDLKTGFTDATGDFFTNLKGEFWDFDGKNSLEQIKNSASSLKNSFSLSKGVVENGFNMSAILEKVVLPSVGLAHIPGGDDMIVVDDFYGIAEKSYKDVYKPLHSLMSNTDIINLDIVEKLSVPSSVSISITEVTIPQIMPSLLAV